MDFLETVYMLTGVAACILGLFGWSHSSLSKRLDTLAIELQGRKTEADIRILIQDKLEPFKIEMQSVSRQLDIISKQYSDLDRKLDGLIESIHKSRLS